MIKLNLYKVNFIIPWYNFGKFIITKNSQLQSFEKCCKIYKKIWRTIKFCNIWYNCKIEITSIWILSTVLFLATGIKIAIRIRDLVLDCYSYIRNAAIIRTWANLMNRIISVSMRNANKAKQDWGRCARCMEDEPGRKEKGGAYRIHKCVLNHRSRFKHKVSQT